MKRIRCWQRFKAREAQPATSAIAISLIAGLLISFQQIFNLAVQHWQKPFLYHDSLYLLRGKNETDTLAWLLKQHNEHRLIFSKIASLAEARFGLVHGQTSLFQSLLLLMIAMLLWWKLCNQNLANRTNQALTTLAGCVILLNPWQYENLTWEFQPPWFAINAIVLGGSVLLCAAAHSNHPSNSNNLWIAIAAGALPWIAIGSSGQGIAFAVAFSGCSWIVSRQMGWIISGSSILALISNFVLLPYTKPDHHPALRFQLDFFLQIWLGGAWQGLALMAAVIGAVLVWRRSKPIPRMTWPAIALPGLFSLLFAGMITLSRSGFGMDQADASRYVTHSLMLGLTALLALACTLDTTRTRPSIAIGGFLVLLTTVGSFPQRFSANGALFTETWKNARQFTRAKRNSFICHSRQIAFKQKGIDLDQKCKEDYLNQHLLISRYLNARTYAVPTGWHQQLLGSPVKLEADTNPSHQLKFEIESINKENENLKIHGWAFTHRADRDLYLLADYADRPGLAFAVDHPRPDVRLTWKLRRDKVGFEAVIPMQRNGLPLTSIRLAGRRNNQKIWVDQGARG